MKVLGAGSGLARADRGPRTEAAPARDREDRRTGAGRAVGPTMKDRERVMFALAAPPPLSNPIDELLLSSLNASNLFIL